MLARSVEPSSVSNCDLGLLSFRFKMPLRLSSSCIAYVISAFELVRIRMSSAKASRSPRLTISLSFYVVPSASSRYTLNNMGETTPPWTTPRSAGKECLPMTTSDYWYILMMSIVRVWSVSLRQRLLRILHSFSLFTVSYAF